MSTAERDGRFEGLGYRALTTAAVTACIVGATMGPLPLTMVLALLGGLIAYRAHWGGVRSALVVVVAVAGNVAASLMVVNAA